MILRTVALILTLALGILAAPVVADAQAPGKVYRIGFLGGASPSSASHNVAAFRQGLQALGYIEGQNIVIEYRFAEGRNERFPDLAAELVRLKVDVILAVIMPAAVAAKNATGTIPIVTANAIDPVETGLVASLARPGGNVTGLTATAGPEITGKQLELLKAAVPRVSRVAVLWNPTRPEHPRILREAEGAARSLRLQLQLLEARRLDEFDSAFAAMTRERAGALFVLQDSMFFLHRTRLADLAAKSRLPTMGALRDYAEAGGLMAYAANLPDLLRRAATFVDKILKGARPADLPMEQPTRFDLIINLKTAKALGLTFPQTILIGADHLIQ